MQYEIKVAEKILFVSFAFNFLSSMSINYQNTLQNQVIKVFLKVLFILHQNYYFENFQTYYALSWHWLIAIVAVISRS